MADVLDFGLVIVKTTEGTAYGAVSLGGVGAGVWSDVGTVCEPPVRVTGTTKP